MNKPVRIQRKRTKGWRMPANTVYVGRPTKWGNPYKAGEWVGCILTNGRVLDEEWAVEAFKAYLDISIPCVPAIDLSPLRGKNLACWCRLDQPCHADVLLELANK